MTPTDTVMADTTTLISQANDDQYGLRAPLQPKALRDHVDEAVNNYFNSLDGQQVSEVYDMVLAEVEAPLLEVVMKHTRHNQTKASEVLGLNRGTLRKKLKQYGML